MSDWNKYHESLLQKWAQTSKTYSIMHSLSVQYYNKWDKRLGIPIVILGAGTASSIFSSNGDETLKNLNGCLVLLGVALTGLSKFLNLEESRVAHQTASYKYVSIAMVVDTMLSFPRDKRNKTPQVFLDKIKNSMLEIRENAPDVRPDILSNYLHQYDKTLTDTRSKVYHWKEKSANLKTEYDSVVMGKKSDNYTAVIQASVMLREDTDEESVMERDDESPNTSPNGDMTNMETHWKPLSSPTPLDDQQYSTTVGGSLDNC
jgi:hypothetical protein